MSYEFLLMLNMACGNSGREAKEEYFGALMYTYCSTTGACLVADQGADDINSEIDQVLANPENFEPGENPPTQTAADTIKRILKGTELAGALLPFATISTYY